MMLFSDLYTHFSSPLKVTAAITACAPGCFFIDSPGGCGKTFTLNLLLAFVRARSGIALPVATSGIAALLLDGGTTAHSRFRIPLGVTADAICGVKRQTDAGNVGASALTFSETFLLLLSSYYISLCSIDSV
jgi:hypothetical protein